MKIALVTDAWEPQINGVVRTLQRTVKLVAEQGHEIHVFHPLEHRTFAMPSYADIRLALFPGRKLAKQLSAFAPDIVHVATEGPLGYAARRYCLRHKLPFTTSYHTQFPEYIRLRWPIPLAWSYGLFRWFHKPSACVMVSTASQRQLLASRGFNGLVHWGRGVDTTLFHPASTQTLPGEGPHYIYMGRTAVEKNIEAFLQLDLAGTKHVVGDGPDLELLKHRYPDAHFTGFLTGAPLTDALAAADVFVFPSKTDTFGLVILEAMACGLPVAAYPVTGPKDIIQEGVTGCLDDDLGKAVKRAAQLDGKAARQYAESCSWRACSAQFSDNLMNVLAEAHQR